MTTDTRFAAFLSARLHEAAALAERLPVKTWRALARRTVEAGRQIAAEHADDDHWCATYPCGTARALGAIWNDHPDYDEAWKPDTA